MRERDPWDTSPCGWRPDPLPRRSWLDMTGWRFWLLFALSCVGAWLLNLAL